MEISLRSALLEWLHTDPALYDALNAFEEESPVRASPPWLGIAASASRDWSTKDRTGREIRIALELQTRSDAAAANATLVSAIERRISSMPGVQEGFEIVTIQFLRTRAQRRARGRRSILLEYQFRLLETSTE